MKFFRLLFFPVLCLLMLSGTIQGQGFNFSCVRDTLIPGCSPVCFTLKATIPDLHGSTNSYTVSPTSYIPGCFPVHIRPDDQNGISANLTIDDRYSGVINIGFPFPFYGTVYNTLIASTNGYLSFDVSNALQFADWSLPSDFPNAGYDRALIAGPWHDLNPNVSQPTQRTQYQVIGVAPHRRWILSYYKVPLFGSACSGLFENTHQIILYESTGLIEVTIMDKQICTGWNSGRALIGIQNWNRNQALMAPGRAAIANPPWGSVGMNESWRFTPAAGPSLFKRVELLDLSGNILSTGTVAPSGPGNLTASFPNVCIPAGTATYIVRPVYEKIDDPLVEIYGVDTINVNRSTVVTATVNTTATTCLGANDGTVVITPTAGTPPFNLSLDGGTPIITTGPYTFNNVGPGNHVVNIMDNSNCPTTLTFSIAPGPGLVVAASASNALCNGSATGIITVTPPNIGTPPYRYSLDSVTWQTGPVFYNLPAGTYTVYVQSSEICPGKTTVTISEPGSLSVASNNINGTCNGGTDGSITVNAMGGVPPYQYSINGTTWQSNNVFNVLPGSYTVTVKDNNGCLTTYPTVVGLTDDLTVTPQNDVILCEGKSAQLNLSSNALQYVWTPATGLSSTSVYNPIANPTQTTRYIVTATLGICTKEDTVLVNVNPAPIPNAGADGYICYGQVFQLNASGGTLYQWSPSTFLDNPDIPNPISTPTKDWTYTLTILSDANGCASLTTDQVRIDVTPPIKVQTSPFDTVAHSNDKIQLVAVPSDTDVIDYTWTPSTGLSDPKLSNPVATAGAVGDVVTYKVITSTIAGCKGEGFVTIRVYKGPDIYVPTGFTPNGDGRNDRFTPFPVGIKNYHYFRVFNRWGQLVFSTTALHEGWDGKLGGRDQPAGTYVWMIEGVTKDDKVITKKGTITLIR